MGQGPNQSGRVRRADCSKPGITRRRRGRGFEYAGPRGRKLDASELERIRSLVIPPAWEDVWICPDPRGHIQATGIDAAGRKQYLYHERWRASREKFKFNSMLDFAAQLPRARRRIGSDLALPDMPRERALACAVRMIDRGSLRVGSAQYAEENETYGVSTLRPEHVTAKGDLVDFVFIGKGGIPHERCFRDQAVAEAVRVLRSRRRAEGLLAYRNGRRWQEIGAEQINAYIKDQIGPAFSAKDFRTWNATVLAAIALSAEGRGGPRAVGSAVDVVAGHLGNTPAVCRRSYIDPRIIDRFLAGEVIGGRLPRLDGDYTSAPRVGPAIEAATLALLTS